MDRIKLLVVDDSILFREVLSRYIQQDDMIEIVGKAGDAYSARDMILQYEPDVMTLDLEMPRMDGAAFLKKLLPQYYISTIVVSSSDERKAACKEAGAVEFLTKPVARTNNDMAKFAGELCDAIRRAYRSNHPGASFSAPRAAVKPAASPQSKSMTEMARVAAMAEKTVSQTTQSMPSAVQAQEKSPAPPTITLAVKHSKLKKSEAIIALGASTGGTEALEQVIRLFPEDTPPVIIVQHMPAGFTKLYSERLNRSCKMEVKEAVDGERLRRGLIVVGAGENHLRLCKDRQGWYVSSKPGEKVSGHCPSVDVMFNSVADVAGPLAIGAILTGMGRDGADGLLRMRQAGAFTIGQDKETCVVYGMPMEAYNCGAVEVQAPLYKIADIILNNLY
ncbi:MAG: chemotaxis-specific protein-glutamate methyltransferase CheB [Lachnospiraceae bacterium]|nr:chemotaxis-specific protein-glutamate methyltransferase CheB [Ruminococcus sp.]MCM1274791.1 chemotaxis-specific protein-glutamate methyltransferase CheB [Lachnospiraceae bacterium]